MNDETKTLTGLEAEAAAVDAVISQATQPAPPGGLAQAAPAVDEFAMAVAGNLALLDAVIVVVEPFAPEVAEPFTTDHRQRIAEAFTRVEQKRGWNLASMFAGYAEEFGLAMALLPPCMAAYKAVQAKAAGPARVVEAAPSSNAVQA